MIHTISTAQIPFGKFFDINGTDRELIDNLRIIKYEEVDRHEPEYLYLLEDDRTDKCYLVHELAGPFNQGSGPLKEFLSKDHKLGKEIPPKRDDWFQTHRIYKIIPA